MPTFLSRILGWGPRPLAALASALIGVVILIAVLSLRFNQPDMALLYGDLDLAEGAQIVSKLEAMDIPYQLKAGGSQIHVPRHQVPRIRMTMAESGLPSGGSLGYEVFDRPDILGATSFVQEVNLIRALEGELARTIRSIQGVTGVRVHLNLPKKEPFSREKQLPAAAVALKMQGAYRLSAGQVQSVQRLVSASVPGLTPDRVTVLDHQGNLLARGEAEASGLPLALYEQKLAHEARLARAIETLVARVVGEGNVMAQVDLLLDRDRVTTQKELFDPDSQALRSQQTLKEQQNQDAGGRVVNAQANTPQQPLTNTSGSKSQQQKVSETNNYEISKTIETHSKEWGDVTRMSAAVLINVPEGQDKTDQALPEEKLQEIQRLVKAAVGYNEKRGDMIEVVPMNFARDVRQDTLAAVPSRWLEPQDWIRLLEMLMILVVTGLCLFLVVRPIVMRALEAASSKTVFAQGEPSFLKEMREQGIPVAAEEGASAVSAAMTAPGVTPTVPAAEGAPQIKERKGPEEGPDTSAFGQILSLIERDPGIAAQVVRLWMKKKI